MPARIQPRPDSAAALLMPLMGSFLAFERGRLRDLTGKLLRRNHDLGGSKDIFVHKGRTWHIEPIHKLRGAQVLPVDPSLVEDVDELERMQDALERDERKLRQSLSVVLTRCRSAQDVRDALPETLVTEVEELRGMRRTRPEGFLLAEAPILKRQYDQAVELALKYAANRLIY